MSLNATTTTIEKTDATCENKFTRPDASRFKSVKLQRFSKEPLPMAQKCLNTSRGDQKRDNDLDLCSGILDKILGSEGCSGNPLSGVVAI